MLGLNPLHASGETNESGHVGVIGGSSGIGLAAARLARDAGSEVTIAGRSQEKLTQAQRELGQVHTVVMDIGRPGPAHAVGAGFTFVPTYGTVTSKCEGPNATHTRPCRGGPLRSDVTCAGGRGRAWPWPQRRR